MLTADEEEIQQEFHHVLRTWHIFVAYYVEIQKKFMELIRPLKKHIRQNWQHFIADTLTDFDVLCTNYILYGVIPSHLIDNILQHHHTNAIALIIQTTFYNALYHMQTALYTLIWKPRCKQTTTWEKNNHIIKDTKEVYDKTRKQQRKEDPVHQVHASAFFTSIQHTTDSATEADLRI